MATHPAQFSKISWTALIATLVFSVAFCVGTVLLLRSSGLEAYKQKDYSHAAWYLFPSAIMGDPETQTLIGQMYAMGTGVERDGGRGIYWLERAAGNGNVKAQTMVGALYFRGVGTAVDLDKARYWLEKAADANDEDAKEMLVTIRLKRNQM